MSNQQSTSPASAASDSMDTVKTGSILGKRRKFLIHKSYQLRVGLLGATLALVLLVIVNMAIYSASLEKAARALENAPELASVIQAQDRVQLYMILIASVVFLAGVFVVGILESHKTAGAAFNVESSMNAVQQGQYSKRIKLRRGDNLRNLEAAFNGMSRTLEEQANEEAKTLEELASRIDSLQDAASAQKLAAELRLMAERKVERI